VDDQDEKNDRSRQLVLTVVPTNNDDDGCNQPKRRIKSQRPLVWRDKCDVLSLRSSDDHHHGATTLGRTMIDAHD
jgi:hypothetical protein